MLKWFYKLFGRYPVKIISVEPPKEAVKDISEPVYAIIKTVEKYPGRWRVRSINKCSSPGSPGASTTCYNYEIKDKTTGVLVKGSVAAVYGPYYSCSGFNYSSEEGTEFSWLTFDEKEALHAAFRSAYRVKVERRDNIQKVRYNKQREKWKEVYCE